MIKRQNLIKRLEKYKMLCTLTAVLDGYGIGYKPELHISQEDVEMILDALRTVERVEDDGK